MSLSLLMFLAFIAATLPRPAAFDSVPRTMFPQCDGESAGLSGNVTTSDFSKPRDLGRVVRKNIHKTAAGLGNGTEPCTTGCSQCELLTDLSPSPQRVLQNRVSLLAL